MLKDEGIYDGAGFVFSVALTVDFLRERLLADSVFSDYKDVEICTCYLPYLFQYQTVFLALTGKYRILRSSQCVFGRVLLNCLNQRFVECLILDDVDCPVSA